MRRKPLLLLVLVLASPGCTTETARHPSPVDASRADEQKPPFTLAIVPSQSWPEARSITLAEKRPDEFYVVLTNVSKEAQLVWESWNSWGYGALSFEIALANGQKIIVSKRPVVFTVNRPSTFLIPPGEHQVYPIRLDKSWDTGPKLPNSTEMKARVKAIYEIPATDESRQYKVWAGRVESDSYEFTLRHW
jgi:hypothetical protein